MKGRDQESSIRDQIVRDFSPLVPIGNDSDSLMKPAPVILLAGQGVSVYALQEPSKSLGLQASCERL